MMQVINSISIDAVVVNQHMHTQMPLRSLAWHGMALWPFLSNIVQKILSVLLV